MLIYHPAFDIYHGIFRLLRLLNRMERQPYPIERVRILDFYLLFPDLLLDFSFTRETLPLKKQLAALPVRYEDLPDPKLLFNRLEPYQLAALSKLADSGYLDESSLESSEVLRTEKELPERFRNLMRSADNRFPDLINALSGPLAKLDLYGKSGLKQRSDLFEYRYDLR